MISSRPDFFFSDCPVSWKQATCGVLVTGDEHDLLDAAYIRFKLYLESYAQQSGASLLISNGRRLFLHGNEQVCESLATYVRDCILNDRVDDERRCVIVDELTSQIILLVHGSFVNAEDSSRIKFREIECNGLDVLPSLWRRARTLSIAVFAVCPECLCSPIKIDNAFTKFTLFRNKRSIPRDAVSGSAPDAIAQAVRLFCEFMAIRRSIDFR